MKQRKQDGLNVAGLIIRKKQVYSQHLLYPKMTKTAVQQTNTHFLKPKPSLSIRCSTKVFQSNIQTGGL